MCGFSQGSQFPPALTDEIFHSQCNGVPMSYWFADEPIPKGHFHELRDQRSLTTLQDGSRYLKRFFRFSHMKVIVEIESGLSSERFQKESLRLQRWPRCTALPECKCSTHSVRPAPKCFSSSAKGNCRHGGNSQWHCMAGRSWCCGNPASYDCGSSLMHDADSFTICDQWDSKLLVPHLSKFVGCFYKGKNVSEWK
jgi:hypothetical protein